jgi:fructokinase
MMPYSKIFYCDRLVKAPVSVNRQLIKETGPPFSTSINAFSKGVAVILVIGEILYDIFGNEKRLGGAPFNFAFHLKHLGFPVRFISRIGDDPLGRELLATLSAAAFDLADIQIDDDHPTGTVDVRLDDNRSPHFEILPNVAYDFIRFDPDVHLPLLSDAKWIYYGSLAQRSSDGFENIQAFLNQKQTATRCFYDINLRPQGYNDAVVAQSLKKSDILKINDSELKAVKNMLDLKLSDEEFKDYLIHHYALKAIALTRGASGSELSTGDRRFAAATVKPRKLVDTVGAGDAFAAMLVAGLQHQWSAEIVLQRASLFAARICEIRGAIPDSEAFYEPFQRMLQTGGEYVD